MSSTYITTLGDTWDIISEKVFQDSKYINLLIENNYKYANIVFFESGIKLNIPEIEKKKIIKFQDWR